MNRPSRPLNWMRVQRHQPVAVFAAPPSAPLAESESGVHWRCLVWAVCICMVDATARTLVLAMGFACLIDLWLMSRSLGPKKSWRAFFDRFQVPPLQFLLFAFVMTLNVALQHSLVQADARPFAVNIWVLHGFILLWAYLTAPDSRAAREGLHFWALVLVSVLSALLFVQSALYNFFDQTIDFREILLGSASRSAGVEEGTEGMRPTSLFEEPSNHALAIFALTFVARITGPRHLWLTVLSAASCLLNNSGLGLLLAMFLVVEEVSYQATIRRLGMPLLMAVLALLALAFIGYEASNVKLQAVEQVIRPKTAYDPVAVRLFVPNAILNFDPIDHLIGTGVSNYASFKDGITQYDSSFILGVYYQMGILGLVMMICTLHRAWTAHSKRAALMLLVLFMSKMGLLAPMFWGITALLERKVALQPNTRAPRPLRLVSLRFLSDVFTKKRRQLMQGMKLAKAMLFMTVPPVRPEPNRPVAAPAVAPFEDTQPAHFETSFFAPDSHSEPVPRRFARSARHARRPHHSELARRRR